MSREIVGFSAGDEFAQLLIEGGGLVRFRKGDEWQDVKALRKKCAEIEEQLDTQQGLRGLLCRAQGLERTLARSNQRCEHLRKYARHREGCLALEPQRPMRGAAPCTCGFNSAPRADSESYDDDANWVTTEQLDGKIVTVHVEAASEDRSTTDVSSLHVSDAIREEFGMTIPVSNIEFLSKNEFGVCDAKVRLGSYEATVKVWIVGDDPELRSKAEAAGDPSLHDMFVSLEYAPEKEKETVLVETFARIARMIRAVADHAQPLEQSGALRGVVADCNALLGKDR